MTKATAIVIARTIYTYTYTYVFVACTLIYIYIYRERFFVFAYLFMYCVLINSLLVRPAAAEETSGCLWLLWLRLLHKGAQLSSRAAAGSAPCLGPGPGPLSIMAENMGIKGKR